MLELTTEEENLLNYVGANYAHVVVLINSTNVMELGQIETIPGVDSCLIVGLSGSEGATAVPEVLWGDKEPSGRTADTWAYDLTTAASYANAGLEGVGKYSNADGLYPADGKAQGHSQVGYPQLLQWHRPQWQGGTEHAGNNSECSPSGLCGGGGR